jgi:hypothetical protein
VHEVSEASSSAGIVLDAVAAGDRRRRSRAVWQQSARVAPYAAALVLLVALAASAAGWSFLVPLGAWLVLVAILLARGFLLTRPEAPADRAIARLDEDAGCGGEIRSASWFASRPPAGPWDAFHVQHAAARLERLDWRTVYPPVQARGPWLAAAVLSIAAFAMPVGIPSGSWTSASASPAAEVLADLVDIEGLTPELTERLLELLAAIQQGQMTPVEALAALREITDFLTIDPALQEQIARLLEDAGGDRDPFEKLNAPALRDAEAMTGDVEWARENLASRLASDAAQKATENAEAAAAERTSENQKPGPTTEQSAEGQMGEASEGQPGARVPARAADAADGAAAMMLGNANSPVGEPGSVFGGKRGNVRYGSADAEDIAASLKREMVEAVVNVDRSDLDNEDRRRKTEQSWSRLSYTRAGSRAAFDRARSDAVRAVPEARRLLVERYFVRPPVEDGSPAGPPAPPRE